MSLPSRDPSLLRRVHIMPSVTGMDPAFEQTLADPLAIEW
jgi:hypothetical protein